VGGRAQPAGSSAQRRSRPWAAEELRKLTGGTGPAVGFRDRLLGLPSKTRAPLSIIQQIEDE
jgi:hypothetical protein